MKHMTLLLICVAATALSAGNAGNKVFATQPAQARNRLVIADYMMWYDATLFDGRRTFDIPAVGPYNSSDPNVIHLHVAQAQQACLDGFSPHWYGPQDPATTETFNKLLQASSGTHLRHAIVIQSNIWPRATEKLQIEAINFVQQHWANHPNYLRIDGRPVIVFTDMPRPFGNAARAIAGWGRVRQATDPEHKMIWMAEGFSTAYLPVFDGLYVYRIDHRACPNCWNKQTRWAQSVRDKAQTLNAKFYFADTIAPGFDDSRSRRLKIDYRQPAPPFARNRRQGQYYRDTFSVTADTNGDFMIVKSFNEWVEGTAIEPGQREGDLYMKLTCELVQQYKSR